MTGAEQKCTKVSSHHLDDWTPELMEALEYKRHCKTKLTKGSKITLESNLATTIENFRNASTVYKQAEKKYGEMKKNIERKTEKFPNGTC